MNLSGSDVDGIANEFDIAQAVLEELWDYPAAFHCSSNPRARWMDEQKSACSTVRTLERSFLLCSAVASK